MMLHALLLAATVGPPAAPTSPTLDPDYPSEFQSDLTALAVDVIACCRELWPGKPPAGERPIVIRHRAAGPLTDSTTDPKTYRLYLSVTGRGYSQFTYQLAHEFAHVMLEPRRTNGLVETVAVAFSLRVLDEMAVRWKTKAPYASWKSYAPEFTRYRQRAERAHLKTFPLSVQALAERKAYEDLALYLRHRRAHLESETNDRDLQHLAAQALLARPVNWGKLVGVAGLTDPPPARDGRFRSDLPLDPERLPAIFRRIGCGREADLVSVEFADKPEVKTGVVLQLGAKKWLWLHESKELDIKALEKVIRDMKPISLRWERGAGQ
jgi:hypothetical protein